MPALLSMLALVAASGCTSRGITVTSQPPGAEVSVNRRVVGHTPIRVGFTHYGTMRIELRKEKFQTLVKEEPIRPPAYGYDPAALVADNVIPARLNDEVYLHYVLAPLEESDKNKPDRTALMERAESARPQPSESGPHVASVTHPRTGEEIKIAVRQDAPKRAGSQRKGAAEGDQVASRDSSSVPAPAAPALGPVPDIKTPEPADAKLRKELGLAEDKDTRGEFILPEASKKPPAARILRTPKDEELLYDKPATPPAEKPAPKK